MFLLEVKTIQISMVCSKFISINMIEFRTCFIIQLESYDVIYHLQCKLKWVYLFIHKGQSFRWQPTHLYTQIHKNVEDCRGTQVQEVQLVITAFIWNFSILRHIKRLFSFYCFFCSHNDFGIYFIYHRINNLAREIRHSCLVSCSPLLLRN